MTIRLTAWSFAIVAAGIAFGLGWLTRGTTVEPKTSEPLPVPSAIAASEPNAIPNEETRQQTDFHWSQVESPSYVEYVANLRAIGCPEQTIRDIIVADVTQLYAPRYAALAAKTPALSWWVRHDLQRRASQELRTQIQALNLEKRRLIERLLGPAATSDLSLFDEDAESIRGALIWSYLPPSQQVAVKQILDRYDAGKRWGEIQWKSLPTAERESREQELLRARQAELERVLSPAELAEFQLRESPTAYTVRELMGKADLTEAEFRTIYALRSEFEKANPEAKPEDWKRLEQETAQALGHERYEDIQRQNNSMWRAMQDLGHQVTDHPIDQETMLRAYAIEKEYTEKMVQAVGNLFADPDQNPAPLRALAAEMESKLSGVLGPELVTKLDRTLALPRLVIQDDGKTKRYSLSPGGFNE